MGAEAGGTSWQRGKEGGWLHEGIPPGADGGGDRAARAAPPGCQASARGGGSGREEEGVEVRGEEGWHRSAAVSVQ